MVPVDGFFEWKAIKGQKAKQPYAIAMKDSSPFGIAGIWENWKEPTSGAQLSCRSNWQQMRPRLVLARARSGAGQAVSKT